MEALSILAFYLKINVHLSQKLKDSVHVQFQFWFETVAQI